MKMSKGQENKRYINNLVRRSIVTGQGSKIKRTKGQDINSQNIEVKIK